MENSKVFEVDVFPTRIYKLQLDKNLIPSDLFPKELGHRKFVDILNNSKYKELNETILKEASKFCPKHFSIGDWAIAGAWINKQKPGEEGFKFHNHTDSFMSCVFYVEGKNMALIVKEEPRTTRPFDTTQDTFFHLSVSHSWHPELALEVQAGDLLIFPSYQIHKANTNTTNTDRISISYNLFPSKNKQIGIPWGMKFKL